MVGRQSSVEKDKIRVLNHTFLISFNKFSLDWKIGRLQKIIQFRSFSYPIAIRDLHTDLSAQARELEISYYNTFIFRE